MDEREPGVTVGESSIEVNTDWRYPAASAVSASEPVSHVSTTRLQLARGQHPRVNAVPRRRQSSPGRSLRDRMLSGHSATSFLGRTKPSGRRHGRLLVKKADDSPRGRSASECCVIGRLQCRPSCRESSDRVVSPQRTGLIARVAAWRDPAMPRQPHLTCCAALSATIEDL